MCCPRLCSHGGWLLLKCSAIGIGFNGAETNCGIARILGILLMNLQSVYFELSMVRNLRFKINWASLIVGSKFTVFAFFTLYLGAIFQVQVPWGLILGGAI